METIYYRGEEIVIFNDENASSPDDWGDDERFIVFDHRQFLIRREGFNPTEVLETMTRRTKKMFYDGFFVFPLSAYIHSGVRLHIGAKTGWDTSFKGFVFIKQMKGSYHKGTALKQAENLVEEWNMYLDGEVYGYNSVAGSCSGFYGAEGKKEMIKEAQKEIDFMLHERATAYFKRKKVEIKHHVPLNKRTHFAFA